MRALKRNIVLSNKSKTDSTTALLTIEKLNGENVATLKFYNHQHSDYMLGISSNDMQVIKMPLTPQAQTHTFVLSPQFDINSKLGAVVVKTTNNNVTPIMWGTLDSKSEYKNVIINEFEKPNKINSNNVQDKPSAANAQSSSSNTPTTKHTKPAANLDEMFEIESAGELDKLISSHLNENEILDPDTDEIKEDLKEGQIFYDLVSDQIRDLFSKFPNHNQLEELIPGSKWVNVEYEDGTKPYVLGLIYQENELKYICYGVQGVYSEHPPKNVENYSQWLPLDTEDPYNNGFWVMYQDAVTGDSVLVETV